MALEPKHSRRESARSAPGLHPGEEAAASKDKLTPPAPPSSKPLQIFLLVALVITGTAYVVNEWTEFKTEDAMTQRPSKLRRLVAAQSKFLTETDLGHQAEAKKIMKKPFFTIDGLCSAKSTGKAA